jgi:hypothetical protein
MTTLWEFSKLVNDKFKIELSDKSIYNILHKHKLTRKIVRSKFYPEKTDGEEKMDIDNFYKELAKYINITKQYL